MSHESYAVEKRYVFNFDLKQVKVMFSVFAAHSGGGKEFHSHGAHAAKALSPTDLSRVLGITSKLLSQDLRFLGGWYGDSSSHRYCGAKLCNALRQGE